MKWFVRRKELFNAPTTGSLHGEQDGGINANYCVLRAIERFVASCFVSEVVVSGS